MAGFLLSGARGGGAKGSTSSLVGAFLVIEGLLVLFRIIAFAHAAPECAAHCAFTRFSIRYCGLPPRNRLR